MKEIEVECYEITEPDGGGMRSIHLAYVSTEKVANDIVTCLGKGWSRSVSKVVKSFSILESVEEYHANTKKALRKSAAAKLTVAELRNLGLDKDGNHV